MAQLFTAKSCHVPGTPLSLAFPPVFEDDSRPGDKVLDRARGQHFPGGCGRGYPGPDVDRHPGEVISVTLDLACMKPGADIDAEDLDLVANGARTPNGPRRTIEQRPEIRRRWY